VEFAILAAWIDAIRQIRQHRRVELATRERRTDHPHVDA